MHNSKLIQLLSTFDKNEWVLFRKYLEYQLPRQPQEAKLFDYIAVRKNNLSSKKLGIDEVRTNSGLGYISRKNTQNIMSKLTLLIEEFLIIESVKNDKYEKELRLFQIYNDRSLYTLSDFKAEALVTKWQSNNRIDLNVYHYLLRLYHSQYFSENPIIYRVEKKLLHKLISVFQDFAKVFSDFYEFVNDHATSLNYDHIFKEEEYAPSDMTNLMLTITSSFSNLHKKSDNEAFELLNNQLISNQNISSELRTMMFEFCDRFLRKQLNLNNDEYYSKKILEFYDFGMQEKIMLYQGSISSLKFQNIIQVACVIKEHDWADQFLLKYKDLVPSQYVSENHSLALVQINCGRKKYDEAIEIVLITDFKTFGLKLLSRWYLLICYFITHDNEDFMDSQINNYSQFIYYNKKRISATNFESSLNLVKIIRLAISNPIKFDIGKEIEKYENIIFKNRLESFIKQRELYIKENNIQV